MTWQESIKLKWGTVEVVPLTADRVIALLQYETSTNIHFTSAIVTEDSCSRGELIDEIACSEYHEYKNRVFKELCAVNRIPTARWIYEQPVISTSTDIYGLTQHLHIIGIDEIDEGAQNRIVICCIFNESDHKYYHALSCIQFDGVYIGIMHDRGRYGDNSNLFITDLVKYRQMLAYLQTLIPDSEYSNSIVDLDQPLEIGVTKKLDEV